MSSAPVAGPRYIVIGRSRDCDLTLADGSVSGRHARMSWKGTKILVEDLGSANGVFFKGRRIDQVLVRPGDEVRFGAAELPWSAPEVKSFLRQGARGDTVVGMTIPGRRFICGACGARGILPDGFKSGTLRCGKCGTSLIVGRGRRALWLGLGVTGLAVVVAAGVLLLASGQGPRTALESVAEHLGLQRPDDGLPVGSPQEASIRTHTVSRVVEAVDATNPTTRNTAVRVAADVGPEYQGPYNIDQLAQVWNHVRERWRYVNDPRGSEYFADASETIQNDYAGDCDDFAIVLAAMITAIGGEARIVMMDGPGGGHAYAEACVQLDPAEVARELVGHYRRTWSQYRQTVDRVHYRESQTCTVWLNLDWNAGVPGGPYEAEQWAVAIYPDGQTETLAPSGGPGPAAEGAEVRGSARPPTP